MKIAFKITYKIELNDHAKKEMIDEIKDMLYNTDVQMSENDKAKVISVTRIKQL